MNVNQYAEVYTTAGNAAPGQEYTLISNHFLYTRFYYYSNERQQFLFNDVLGVSDFARGDYFSSPYEILTGPSLEIENQTIYLGITRTYHIIPTDPTIQKVQYQEPDSSTFIDITSTLFVLKDSSVTFKAVPNPDTETFPSGQPTWSGTSGTTGSGQTISITFNTTSSSSSDYKTVIVSTTAGTTVTVNVIVYELTGTLTPQDNFAQRNQNSYGVAEKVDLNFSSNPALTIQQVGGLTWRLVRGLGGVPQNTNGIVTYSAPDVVSTEVIKLEITNGPSKGSGISYTKTIVAPSDAVALQMSNSSIRHTRKRCNVGFNSEAYLIPTDVSFGQAKFFEGMALAVSSGYYGSVNCPQPPLPANPICAVHDMGQPQQITNCNITTGCFAFLDIVETDGPPPCTDGDFIWDIPWNYVVGNGTPKNITTARHHQYTTNPDMTSIEKKGVGPFTRKVSDPTTY